MDSKEKDDKTKRDVKSPMLFVRIFEIAFGLCAVGAIVWLFVTAKWEYATILIVAVLVIALGCVFWPEKRN